MQFTNHGANPENLYKSHNIMKPRKIIDFSTNTNVVPKKYFCNINRLAKEYPDFKHLEIKKILSYENKFTTDNIIVSNGINEVIYLLAQLYNDRKVCLLKDDYTEYKRAFKSPIYYDELSTEIVGDILVFSNPNNPTGTYHNYEQIIDKLSKRMLVVIDESYVEFIEDKKINVKNNVLVMRSLTKIYHLSGIRIGYALGDVNLIKELSSIQPTWSVNSVALAMAKKYLLDKNFLFKTRKFYRYETSYLKKKIKEIGYSINESSANFFLIEVSDDESIIRFLLKKGIVVRHTRNFQGLNGQYIRVSVKKRSQNKKLLRALKEYKNENISN